MINNYHFSFLGGDIQQEGLAGYRLGNAYEEIGDPETAILVRKILIDYFCTACTL